MKSVILSIAMLITASIGAAVNPTPAYASPAAPATICDYLPKWPGCPPRK